MAKDTEITIDKFPQGFVSDFGTNKVPEYFAEKCINLRLVNWWITVRNWHIERYTDTWVASPQWITWNEYNNLLIYVYNWTAYSIETSWFTAATLWSITSTNKARFINHGAYTIILTWDQRPFWYNWDTRLTMNIDFVASNSITMEINWVAMTPVVYDTSNFTTYTLIKNQLESQFSTLIKTVTVSAWSRTIDITPKYWQTVTVTDFVVTLWASQAIATISKVVQCTTSEIDDWVNPSFWGSFAWFTIINRLDSPNVISVSRPISLTTLWYAKDWKWSNSYTITLKWLVQWMVATLSRFWIFTDKTIEYLSPNFLDTTGSYVPTTFAWWELLASPDCVWAAWDVVFYVTKNKRIRSIWYQWTINEPQIKTISDIENAWIQRFLDEQIKEDQSQAFIHHDELNNIMKFHFVWINSSYADTILCWDLNTNQWLLDLDKQYSWICSLWSKQYAYSWVWRTVYEDEFWEDDDWNWIEREYETQNMWITEPNVVKMRKWWTIWWQMNNEAKILVKVYIDGNLYFEKYIDWELENPISLWWVWEFWIWEWWVWEVWNTYTLVDFEKDIDLWRLRKTWKKIKINFSWNEIGQKLIIDYLSLKFKPRQRKRVRDKKFTSI